MRTRLVVLAATLLVLCLSEVAAEPGSSQTMDWGYLKQHLTEKYRRNKTVALTVDGIFAGGKHRTISDTVRSSLEFAGAEGANIPDQVEEWSIPKWYHFHDSVAVPMQIRGFGSAKIASMQRLDERTFGNTGDVQNITNLVKGEMLRIDRFVVHKKKYNKQELIIAEFVLDTTDPRHREPYHTLLTFQFDKDLILNELGYDAVVKEISSYLLPSEEAAVLVKASRDVELDVGMTEEEVIQELGKPLKSIQIGSQKLLQYEDMTIVLGDGKLTDVKLK